MATLCKNCSHALVFDPETQKLVCSSCGSSFTAEEVEAESKQYRQDLRAESMETIYGGKLLLRLFAPYFIAVRNVDSDVSDS